MRSGQPIISRPAWYDRNPEPGWGVYFAAAVAPHALTTRWSYTVPTGKKTFLEAILCWLMRAGAAATVGRVYALIQYLEGGVSGPYLAYASIRTNSVGDGDSGNLGQSIIMVAGDIIRCQTSDGSTGGAVDYNTGFKATEFDA